MLLQWVTAFLAFKGEKNLDLFAKRRLDVHGGDGLPLSEFDTPFASLLTESKSYSLLGRSVGIEAARRMLLAIHDISLLTAEGEDVPSWPGFFVEEPFTHAMTRASEGYFAFRQGALALAGKGTEDVDARQHLAVSLTRYGPKLSFDMDFGGGISSLRGRMAVIIGKNGCGKTNSLVRLAAGLSTDKRQGVSFRERPNVNQVPQQNSELQNQNKPLQFASHVTKLPEMPYDGYIGGCLAWSDRHSHIQRK